MAPDLKKLCLLIACLIPAAPGLADETAIGANVSLELNATKSGEDSCTLTFMVINGHPEPIDKAVYETVLFDVGGQVDRLTLFDFGTLPPGRPRVRQFSVTGTTCEQLGQVLINGAHACAAPALSASACETGLQLSTRTEIEVTG
ncbi:MULTISPECIES: hypothetical protein [unclassified Roseovarius]|uniref:hypothetical protein n=1 Tax=unclassified Roseovarius TaxID=2614913 RepID=UPI00273E0BEB|nr:MULTISPECIES: hypothetical protein [unclassified Roseovarius]